MITVIEAALQSGYKGLPSNFPAHAPISSSIQDFLFFKTSIRIWKRTNGKREESPYASCCLVQESKQQRSADQAGPIRHTLSRSAIALSRLAPAGEGSQERRQLTDCMIALTSSECGVEGITKESYFIAARAH